MGKVRVFYFCHLRRAAAGGVVLRDVVVLINFLGDGERAPRFSYRLSACSIVILLDALNQKQMKNLRLTISTIVILAFNINSLGVQK
jgi:hypothetical protein